MLVLSLFLIALLVGEDQLIKLYVVQNFAECRGAVRNYYTFSIGDFNIVSLTHVRNSGAAWSVLSGKTLFLTVFTVAAIALIMLYLIVKHKTFSRLELLAVSFVIAGGVGNLIDRFRILIEGSENFRGVIDYIKLDFINFPVFNFADCCITVGASLWIISVLAAEVRESKMKKAAKAKSMAGSCVDISEASNIADTHVDANLEAKTDKTDGDESV